MLVKVLTCTVFLAAMTAGAAAQYDAAAVSRGLYYCKASTCRLSALASWSCGPSCAFNGGAANVQVIQNETAGTRALILFNPNANEVVVNVRDTRNGKNWAEDADLRLVHYGACSAANVTCRVHHGFLYALDSLINAGLLSALQQLYLSPEVPTDADVLVVGHSLGGAVATLLAPITANLLGQTWKRFNALRLITFGSPRVGDEAFTAYVADSLSDNAQVRLTHSRDPVPHLPFQAWGYDHVPSEVFFPHNTSTDFKLCNDGIGFEDKTCSDGLLAINPYDHIWYLGICTDSCDPAEGGSCCESNHSAGSALLSADEAARRLSNVDV